MRLIKVRLNNFRRFGGMHSLDLNEDLIALVGPNEAGKSSILYAIDLLGRGESPAPSDRTRGQEGPATISGLFVLDAQERAALDDIPGGSEVTHLWIEVREGATRMIWRPEPPPHRDLEPRRRCQASVAALEGDPALDATYSQNEEWAWDPQLLEDVSTALASDDETLSTEIIQSFESLARRLHDLEYPPSTAADNDDQDGDSADLDRERLEARREAEERLFGLADIERRPTPVRQVIDALEGPPAFAFFKEEDRQLQRDYQVTEVADDPPPPLANLCVLAGLSLSDVRDALAAGRIPHVEKLFEEANRTLKDRFQATWNQSMVYPRFGTPSDGVLRILIATEGEEDYSYPEERSDGLRWFIALHAFLVARAALEPVLLVDEAETHLHYDAQADLIDALMSQRIASKVVYTTHSVGCLPPDLGCGIRAVLAERDAERSSIANSYWSVSPEGDRVGYTPLLFAMGAQLLSLTIPRYGVISEGPSDAILLPSLLREAGGIDRLPYRIVPGLSELADEQVASLSHHAGRVVCLTDDDDSGATIRGRLEKAGIASDTIYHLGRVCPGCTLEDLVRAEIFAIAVNTELDTWGLGPLRIDPSDLPSTGRWSWLETQGMRTGTPVEKLSKARVAQRIVDAGRPQPGQKLEPRLAPHLRRPLSVLHAALVKSLGIAPEARKSQRRGRP